ncbi:MAG: hypothetical protein AAGF11_18470 [Myxococcota bacterium]
MSNKTSTDQVVRRVLYLGPAPDDDSSVVVTVELTCGCEVTRVLSERRVAKLNEGGFIIKGDIPCPNGHPSPAWLHERTAWFSNRNRLARTG